MSNEHPIDPDKSDRHQHSATEPSSNPSDSPSDSPSNLPANAPFIAEYGSVLKSGDAVPDAQIETYRLSSPSPMIGDEEAHPVMTPMHTVTKPDPTAKKSKRSKVSDMWALWAYNALVFVTSVCVMTLELTASRLIQKSVGSSLYTWTSVIGVVLAGITLGNFFGGWLADRYHRGRMLAWMYLFGSVSSASVLWLDPLISPLSRPVTISLPTWVLMIVSAMFLLPSLALGTISPLVASLALSRSSRTGVTVGNVYAWGALGSIIGTFLTGFYLMDVFGTRTIIGLTSGTLGLLAVVVAGSPRLFRVAVVCGWLQLLGWTVLAATCTEQSMAMAAGSLGTIVTITQESPVAVKMRANWSSFGGQLGTKLQELGLLLKLRDDHIGSYYDESSYSTIMVSDDAERGQRVKYLRLDKLIHSYYDQANPTELHYEYEQIYAAVTKRTARQLTQPVTLSTKSLPSEYLDATKLPDGTTLNEAAGELRIERPTSEVFDALLGLAPSGELWKAIDLLYADTTKPLWGGFSSFTAESIPEEFAIPADLGKMVLLDQSLGRITAYEALTSDVRDRLIDATPHYEWYREVQRARGMSRRATSLFIGGGGFIFPRWFLKQFPGSPRIDVAELDPAVYLAAIKAMGFTENDQRRIHTAIGDARNFVDDRLRDNRRASASGTAPVKYDFVYGDAFNDFSIPAHLTTLEFLQKVNALLSDDGVFLMNLIDIYPRFEVPGTTLSNAETIYQGSLPNGLYPSAFPPNEITPASPYYAPLEFKPTGNNGYRIRARSMITTTEQRRFAEADWPTEATEVDKKAWANAINQLALQTQMKNPFPGTIPSPLQPRMPHLDVWMPVPGYLSFVETYYLGEQRYVLGFRGLISPDLESELVAVDPTNREWVSAVKDVSAKSRRPGPGRFLGRFVATAAAVFPNLYLFSAVGSRPANSRDTFVLVCSRRPLDLSNLKETGDWYGDWFAALETDVGQKRPTNLGQMGAVLSLSEGKLLTDDFAPVDNLLVPVFAEQH